MTNVEHEIGPASHVPLPGQTSFIDRPLTFGSLFAGIGGMDLGLERAGLQCHWQVEIDPFARGVLAKHWPEVRRHDDVRTFPPEGGSWNVDCIAGGFPCQDVSTLGRGAGLDGERSGLWSEFRRLLRDLRPRYAVIENVSALRFRGLDRVLCDLAAIGFDAEWESLPAEAFGAPHGRDRVFIVAHSHGLGCDAFADIEGVASQELAEERAEGGWRRTGVRQSGDAVPDRVRWVPNGGVCRVVDGVPGRMDRYRGLGNAIVPQVAEFIGRRLIEFDRGLAG